MSAITATPPGARRDSRDTIAAWAERLALPVILLVAAANFAWQLGSSSYFVDEAFSVLHSAPSFGAMFHFIARYETTPWPYFVFLHEWMGHTGSEAEWVTRLPSVVAGVALVWGTYWMAGAFVSRRPALAAAALAALSPLITSYAQETRVYVFLMLALVIAVGAAVRAAKRTEAQNRLLILGALAAFVAIWLHYIALSVVLPLLVWVEIRPNLRVRQRAGLGVACVSGI